MKKSLFIAVLFFTVSLNVFSQTAPTCSLDPTFISSPKNGVWPDSLTNFLSGTVGVPYEQNVTVKVPLDTVQTLKFCFNRVVVSTPSNVTNYNLPPGLLFDSSTPAVQNGTINGATSLKFPGNANNCATFFGTPTTAGTYTLSLKVETYASLAPSGGFGNCPLTPTVSAGTLLNTTYLNYYVITINAPAGINELVNEKNFKLTNQPNPFDNSTRIEFTVKDASTAKIEVFDILGKKVYGDEINTNYGKNKYDFHNPGLNNGIYFYTVTYKNYSETKKMIISGN